MRTGLYIFIVWLVMAFAFPARGEEGRGSLPVQVEGGPDASGHLYTWTVTNRGSSAITAVEFPAWNADLFQPPPGWSADLGDADRDGALKARPGWFLAFADTPYDGIVPGGSDTFSMRIRPRGARRGAGTVIIHFADGTQVEVPGVMVPMAESLGDKYVSLVGLGAIFVIAVAIQAIRSRHKRKV
jgi:hypothetical protein